MKERLARIHCVTPGSIAEEAGIEPGDTIVKINGQNIGDIFDYRFLITDEELLLELEKSDGELWEVEIEKEQYEDLGIEFESSMIDDAKSCTNKCLFCFIDQLPKGMRDTLYFKDDDSRLSFLMGNYVTLTNMKDDDIDRVIRYRMSPINVSVHATNPTLRTTMLGNRFAGNIMDRIKKIVDGGITVNCQIVLCRQINDGKELDKTISDLAGFYPGIKSVSIVPVGITRYREGLYPLQPFDEGSSRIVVSQVEKWQNGLLHEHGSRIVYLADEFYIMAGQDIPDYDHYEDFPQIENGVGLIAQFRYEFNEYLDRVCDQSTKGRPSSAAKLRRIVSVATGVSAYQFIKEAAELIEQKCSSVKVNVYEIKNDFFGENVTVAGLLTGQDIVAQLLGKNLGDELLISKSMLKAEKDVFLDDYSVKMVEQKLDVKVTVVENSGEDFIRKIIKN